MEIQLVVADMAGTLADFGSCAPAQAFVELFSRHNVRALESEARGPMGMQKRDHIAKMLELPHLAKQWGERKGSMPDDADLDALYAEFSEIQLDILPKFSDLVPGALACAEELRQMGIKVAASTGYNREMAEVVVGGMQAQGLTLDAYTCAEDVSAGRPAPWMIFRAMEILNAYPPATVLNVGDTLPDILSGCNAGVWSVGVTDTGNMTALGFDAWNALPEAGRDGCRKAGREAMKNAGAHYVINSIVELPQLISEINIQLKAGKRP